MVRNTLLLAVLCCVYAHLYSAFRSFSVKHASNNSNTNCISDFVRLHQPYSIFTAGARSWAIAGRKPANYLASKKEILAHFEDIVKANVQENGINLIPLFGYQYTTHAIVDGAVELTVRRMENRFEDAALAPPPCVHIRADRMIKAMGANIQIKRPFPFAPTTRVVSLCPADILTPSWNAYMRSEEARDKPIYFIGSGKTAMDCVYHLCRTDDEEVYKHRLHCVAGRGVQFMNRDMLFPTGWFQRNIFGT